MTRVSGQVRLVIVALVAALFGFLYYNSTLGPSPYQWGAVSLLSFWVVIWLLTGRLNPFALVIGADGRPSTSKLKPFLWTIVVIFGYAVLYAARVKKGHIEAISEIPPNLLIAIGLDAATLVAARGITESQVSSGQIEKPPPVDSTTKADSSTVDTLANSGPGAVFQDDKGFPDLTKIQTITWTAFAIVIYLVAVNAILNDINSIPYFTPGDPPLPSKFGLPDIAPALMVLIGLGNAAYLGKKLVTTETPVLTALAVERKPTGVEITVKGVALGATQDGSRITINNKELNIVPLEWANDHVKFRLPDKNPEGGDWIVGQTVQIALFVRGQATNQLSFTIEPSLDRISPNTGAAGIPVTLSGIALGPTPGTLLIDDTEVTTPPNLTWSNNEVRFDIPAQHPNGKPWTAGQKISISVIVQKIRSNKLEFTVT